MFTRCTIALWPYLSHWLRSTARSGFTLTVKCTLRYVALLDVSLDNPVNLRASGRCCRWDIGPFTEFLDTLRKCICCTMCALLFFFLNLDAGLLARSQYSEGPATGHLDTGFSRFPCVYKQMLRRFPTFQVATTCFSCSPSDLNLLVNNFTFCIHVK